MVIKENRGITLVALVITIIILLILAGTTLYTLTGENGLIAKTIHAQEENKKTAGLEEIKLAIIASYNNEGGINQTKQYSLE